MAEAYDFRAVERAGRERSERVVIYRAIDALESNLAVQPSPVPEKPDRFPRSRGVVPELPRSAGASRVGPAVSKAHEILDFDESAIAS